MKQLYGLQNIYHAVEPMCTKSSKNTQWIQIYFLEYLLFLTLISFRYFLKI